MSNSPSKEKLADFVCNELTLDVISSLKISEVSEGTCITTTSSEENFTKVEAGNISDASGPTNKVMLSFWFAEEVLRPPKGRVTLMKDPSSVVKFVLF